MTLSKENIKVGLVIINKNNPNWGEWTIDKKYGDGIWDISNHRGGTTLFEDELHFWRIK